MNYEKIIEIYNIRNVVSPPTEFYGVRYDHLLILVTSIERA